MGERIYFEFGQTENMKKIFIYTIFLILSFNQLRAEFVNDIKIEGNKRVSDETILIYGELEKNKDYSEKDLDKVLKNLFSTDFFKDININITNKILKISVKEYPIISQLTILGEPKKSFREQIIKIMDSKQKTSFINSKLSNDIEKIKQLYSSVGYNFAKIESKFRNIDESNIDLVIEIERGNESKIISINFLGDKKVSSKRLRSVIASEEDKFWKIISKNTKFNQNLIDLDERLLKNYYKSIGYRDVEINSNAANISESGDVNLVYSVDAGNRYTINKISTNLDKVYNQKTFFPLNKVYKKYIGDYYSPFKI